MAGDERKKPRRALDLRARRAIREFLSLLPGLDLPTVARAVPFSYEAPISQSSAVEVAVILAGERPPDAQAQRTGLWQTPGERDRDVPAEDWLIFIAPCRLGRGVARSG